MNSEAFNILSIKFLQPASKLLFGKYLHFTDVLSITLVLGLRIHGSKKCQRISIGGVLKPIQVYPTAGVKSLSDEYSQRSRHM